MNMYEWLNNAMKSEKKKAMPVLSFPGTQLMDISVVDLINSSDNQAECMKLIAEKFDSLASVSLMDLSVEAEAFGSKIVFSDDEVPTVIGSIIQDDEDAENLVIPKVGDARTGLYVETIAKAKKLITDKPVLAGIIGPFSLAGRLMDMTEIMIKAMIEPEQTHLVMQKVASFLTDYAKAMKSAGADGLVIAEPAAGLLSPALCQEFSSDYLKPLIEEVQDENFIVVYHNCGNAIPLSSEISYVGAKAYHFGDAIDIVEMLKRMPSDVPVMGNLSPVHCFKDGTVDSVYKSTIEMLENTKEFKNYIPSSGCDIPPLAPIDNIASFFKAVEDFYNK